MICIMRFHGLAVLLFGASCHEELLKPRFPDILFDPGRHTRLSASICMQMSPRSRVYFILK